MKNCFYLTGYQCNINHKNILCDSNALRLHIQMRFDLFLKFLFVGLYLIIYFTLANVKAYFRSLNNLFAMAIFCHNKY
jgi:hypothetical protein